MSSMFMHTDSTIYPEPEKFLPERWLGDVNPDMMRNFVPFARGKELPAPLHQSRPHTILKDYEGSC